MIRNKSLYIALICMTQHLLCVAQRAELQTINGKEYHVILADGLPVKVIKTLAEVNATIDPATHIIYRHSPFAGNGTNPNINAKVSPRFAISPNNVIGTGSGVTTGLTYANSWMNHSGWIESGVGNTKGNFNASATPAVSPTGCRAYKGPHNINSEQGKWRVPTQRELLLIHILSANLLALPNFHITSDGTSTYWSSTEYTTGKSAYAIGLGTASNSGFTVKESNSDMYGRCVRDLDYGGGMP